MRKHLSKRMTALLLALVMCMGLAVPAGAADTSRSVKIEKVDNSAVSVSLTGDSQRATLEEEETPLYQATDVVRVSIVLDGKSTLEKGFSTMSIAENSKAMAYRSSLQAQQEAVTQKISRNVLGGEDLDVVWNLTLAANIISANVPYGDIDAIKAVSGVEDVVLETRYEPQVVSVDSADPNMATSSSMIGSDIAHADGYYGAGSRIAIIDTGTDTDHQSFNEAAFLHAIDGKTDSLMTVKDIEDVLGQLNITKRGKTVEAKDLYINAKLPFGCNYVDGDTDVTHDNDSQSEHGSHVAGIAAANRYIANGDGTFSNALDVAHMQGVAPDAQIITMKVFGKNGGAYDADYMAAIEDAILLGCDSINLSLGSSMAGMGLNSTYQKLLDQLTESDSVVSISAGNAGYWAENSWSGSNLLYSDDVNFHTGGSPGTYTNALTVASADNVGMTGSPLLFYGNKVFYTEPSYRNAVVTSLDKTGDGSGTEYEFVYLPNFGTDSNFKDLQDAGVDFTGKVVLINRGSTSFSDKHMAAAKAGGVACIVVNSVSGEINMDLSASTATIPCVLIPVDAGSNIRSNATAVKNDSGRIIGYTGTMTISSTVSSASVKSTYDVSSFSSWGVPSTLQLKPEITAPGGNIYSVNGKVPGGKAYENMSGTSMAAPQISGMAALVAEYLKQNNVTATGLTRRALIQSLLMSTAVPLTTTDGTYYSLLQQGAGLANVGDAINAHSYIVMDTNATSGAADGKVKAELGDDPAKKGVYTFGFTLYDLSGEGGTYDLSGDVFVQAIYSDYDYDYLDTATTALAGAKVTFDQDGVTLAANGSAHVNVTIDVTGCSALENYPCGTYIQAFIKATEKSTEEGVVGTTHTIPVLGFYGSWTDASMYDVGNAVERRLGLEDRYTYLDNDEINVAGYTYAGEVYQRFFGQNRYKVSEEYLEERNSLNNTTGEKLIGFVRAAIRNAGDSISQVVDAETGKVYVRMEQGPVYGAYYYTAANDWANAGELQWFQWAGTDQAGNALPEGTKVNYQLILAPEYYADANGNYDWDALTDGNLSNGELGEGAYLSVPVTIDNTAPEILSAEMNGSTLTVTAKDQRYIACMGLFNVSGTKVLQQAFPNQKTANTTYTWTVDMSSTYGTEFLIGAYDYAGNLSVYALTIEEPFNAPDTDSAIIGATANSEWYAVKDGTVSKINDTAMKYFGAAYVGGKVFLSGNGSALYVADMDSLDQPTYVASFGCTVTNLAYDYSTETLYGAATKDGMNFELVEIDMTSGAITEIGALGVDTNMLATDSKGTFYSIEAGSGDLYTFTLATLANPTRVGSTGYLNNYVQGLTYNNNDGQLYWAQYYVAKQTPNYDINGDRKTDAADAQLILDYASGKLTEEEQANYNFSVADINNDGRIDTFDAHLLLNLNKYNSEIAYLLRVDTEDASTQIAATLPTETGGIFAPDNTTLPAALTKSSVERVVLSQDTLSVSPSVSTQLTAAVYPWYMTDRTVTWTSSNDDVATVDGTGLITAHNVGTATITAASTANPSIADECVVTVTAVDVTITGALQDADRNAQLFTWNMGTNNTWTPGVALENGVESVVLDGDGTSFWQMDTYNFNLHRVSLATGEVQNTYSGLGMPMAVMGYSPFFSEEAEATRMYTAYEYNLYLRQDPTALSTDYMYFAPYLMMFAQSGKFVGMTSGIPGKALDSNEVLRDGETIYMLDNGGHIWMMTFYYVDGELSITFKVTPSDKLVYALKKYPTEGPHQNCSMVRADNGDLFVSYFTGDHNVLYRLRLNEDESMYNATLIADFGEGVRPAALLSATYNSTETTNAGTETLSTASALFNGTVAEFNAMSEVYAAQLGNNTTLTSFNVNASTSSSTSAGTLSVTPGQGDSKTVTLDLNAEMSTNGKLTVGYDTSVLTLASVEPTSLALNSYVTAENGTVTYTYANKTAVTGKLATLTFSYDVSTAPASTVVTVTTLEEGGTQKEIAQKVTLKLKDEVIVPVEPVTPVTPVTPVQPTNPDKPSDPKKGFDDVKQGDWFYDEVTDLADKGYINGVSDNLFAPNQNLSRGMLVTILYRMDGEKAVANTSAFSDVVKDSWYEKAVNWAAANGIVYGYDNGCFGPNDMVTRQQMAAILWRYAQYKGIDVAANGTVLPDFPDRSEIAAWAGEAVSWAYSRGVMTGKIGGKLDPNGNASRAEAAVMLYRFLKLSPNGEKQ